MIHTTWHKDTQRDGLPSMYPAVMVLMVLMVVMVVMVQSEAPQWAATHDW